MPDDAVKRSGPAPNWTSALAIGLAVAIMAKRPLASVSAPAAGTADVAPGRTAQATTPVRLTARDWREILLRVSGNVGKDRVLAVSAGVTFYALLAIFPAITALVSLYGLIADPGTISNQLDSLRTLLPSGALDIIGEQVKRIASKPHGSLGFGFVFGLLVALWSANAGMKALFDALNVVYEEQEKRGFIKLNLVSLTCTLGALAFIFVALGAVIVVPVALNFVHLGPMVGVLVSIARWPILLLLIVLALAVLYRFGPSRRAPQWRWVTGGSAFAAIGWVIGSMLFSWYVESFGTYNETYGSLGAAIGFMTWIWISSTIVLVGAQINAETERQTAADTTSGPPQPRGRRGARMADDLAA